MRVRWCPRERREISAWQVERVGRNRTRLFRCTCGALTQPTAPRTPKNKTADQRWSKAVRERDGDVCRRCGRPATDGAHVRAKSIAGKIRHHTDNGVALCRACHDYMTRHPNAWKEWLAQHAPGLLEQLQGAAR